jgi:hypothetical protein
MWDSRLVFVLSLLSCAVVLGPYVLGIGPRSSREWRWIALTLLFLFWMLGGYRNVRADRDADVLDEHANAQRWSAAMGGNEARPGQRVTKGKTDGRRHGAPHIGTIRPSSRPSSFTA